MLSLRRAAIRAAASFSSTSSSSSRPIIASSQSIFRQKISASLSTSIRTQYNNEVDSESPGRPTYVETNPSRSQSDDETNFSRVGSGPRSDRPTGPPVDLSPNPSIYVGNLVFDLTVKDIEREFAPFGEVKNVSLATDARGLSKGFGYVEFGTIEEAEAAIEAKNQTILEGRRLIVNYQAKPRRSLDQNPPSKTLFVGNLAFEISDADMHSLFKKFPNCVDVRVAVDRRTGQPRGFAHADFVTVEDAQAAKDQLADMEVYGRKLRVDFSAGIKGNPSAESRGQDNSS